MKTAETLAHHFKILFTGPNYPGPIFEKHIEEVDWKMATTRVYELNTIAKLVYHINYYVSAVLKVLEGGPLDAHDKYSFNCPEIQSEEDWQNLLEKHRKDVKKLSDLAAQLNDDDLWGFMADEKYGSYFRNLLGLIEHSYYHFGQIVLLKKIIQQQNAKRK